MPNINRYYISSLSAYLIWGFIPISLKFLSDYPSGAIMYFRVIFSLIILLIISFLVQKERLRGTLRKLWNLSPTQRSKTIILIFLSGIALATHWLSYIYVINNISVQIVAFAYLICPIITAFLGFLVLKEPLEFQHRIAILLSSISCFILGSGSWENAGLVLIIAVSSSCFLILQSCLRKYDKMSLLTFYLMIAFIITAPLFSTLVSPEIQILNMEFISMILIISILFTILPLLLNTYALKGMTAGAVGILSYLNPFINFIVAFLIYQENSTWLQILAYAFIFISIILYNWRFSN